MEKLWLERCRAGTVQGEDFQRKRFYWTTDPPCSDSAMGWICFSHILSLVKSDIPTSLFLEGRKGRGKEKGKGEGKRKGRGERKGEGERGGARKGVKKGEGGR